MVSYTPQRDQLGITTHEESIFPKHSDAWWIRIGMVKDEKVGPSMHVWNRGGLCVLPVLVWHSTWTVRLIPKAPLEVRCASQYRGSGAYCRGKPGCWSSNGQPEPCVWLMWIFLWVPLTVSFGSLFQCYHFLFNLYHLKLGQLPFWFWGWFLGALNIVWLLGDNILFPTRIVSWFYYNSE